MTTSTRIIAIILLTIAGTSSTTAQSIGPPPRAISFRLYGRDARPITEKDREFSVTLQTTEKEARLPQAHWNDNRFWYWMDGYDQRHPYDLAIAHGRDTMLVTGAMGVDSLVFQPGRFDIPWAYAHLPSLHIDKVEVSPRLEEFRAYRRRPRLDMIRCEHMQLVRADSFFGGEGKGGVMGDMVYDRARNSFVALLAVVTVPQSHLYIGHEMGKRWERIPNPLGSVRPTYLWLRGEENDELWVIGFDEPRWVHSRSRDGGRSWSRIETIELPRDRFERIDSVMLDPRDRYGGEKSRPIDLRDGYRLFQRYGRGVPDDVAPDVAWVLERTEDGGKSWQRVLSHTAREAEHARMRFYDSQLGALVTPLYILQTIDGGKSWRYRPFEPYPQEYASPPYSWCGPRDLQDFFFLDYERIVIVGLDGYRVVAL